MPPRRLSRRRRPGSCAESSLVTSNRAEEAKTPPDFATNLTRQNDKKLSYINMLRCGCAGNLKPTRLSLQIGELQGDLAQLQGTIPSHPAEDPLHLSGLDGFLPNSRSRETIILSREGRIRNTCRFSSRSTLGSLTDTRSRTRNVCFTPKSGHARRPNQCPLCARSGRNSLTIPSWH
jgi:hypothetical protein